MKSELFAADNLEIEDGQRFALQNSRMLRVSLGPDVLSTRSMLRCGSREAFQYAFHGPGSVVVQPYEWVAPASGTGGGTSGGFIGDLLS